MNSFDITEWGKPLQQAVRAQPQPSGTQVLTKVRYCGVCHSDVHIRDGFFELGGGKRFHMTERGMKLPVTMGHEPYGELISLGPQAQGLAPVQIGHDYLVYPWTGCGQCARCQHEQDNWCMTPRFLGVQSPGGYADYLLVPHPKYLVDASGIDPQFAPILACSGLTTYSAVRKLLPCDPHDAIVVMGAGGLGLMAICRPCPVAFGACWISWAWMPPLSWESPACARAVATWWWACMVASCPCRPFPWPSGPSRFKALTSDPSLNSRR